MEQWAGRLRNIFITDYPSQVMSRAIIDFLFLPDKPLKKASIFVELGKDFHVDKKLKEKIERMWLQIQKSKSGTYSQERSLASLKGVTAEKNEIYLDCAYTHYKTSFFCQLKKYLFNREVEKPRMCLG